MKISVTQYAQALFELTAGKSEAETLVSLGKFVTELRQAGEFKNVGKILNKFEEIYNQQHGIMKAVVVTKNTLPELEHEKIKEFIQKRYAAKEVEFEKIVDERIKGGIIIRVGDEILDAGLAGKLKRLKNILVK